MKPSLIFRVDRFLGFVSNRIHLHIGSGHDRIVDAIAAPIILQPYDSHPAPRHEPCIELTHDEATELINELWLAGVRPSVKLVGVGDIEAVREHLADMKAVAWAALGKAGMKP